MRAVWYERQGPAHDVLIVGELPDPAPGDGEVCVRVRFSGVNPGDTKKRRGWLGSAMPYPRVIPHSDAAGVIESVGTGVEPSRVGQRVWVFGAQSYRPFGTAAELTVVPTSLAIGLPDDVSDEIGACLGIPGITAHRAVFVDGPVDGATRPRARCAGRRRVARRATGALGRSNGHRHRPANSRCAARRSALGGPRRGARRR